MGRFIRHPQASGGFSGGDVGSPIGLADGTESAPALYFTSDDDGSGTGFFRQSADQIGVSCGGAIRYKFSASAFQSYENINLNGNRVYDSTAALNLGTAASTSHSLGTGDVIVGGKLEVDGPAYFDGDVELPGGKKVYVSTNSYLDRGGLHFNDFSSAVETIGTSGAVVTKDMTLRSGAQTNAGNYASGDVYVYSGGTTTDGDTGNVSIFTGAAGAGAADAGDIFMSVNGAPGTGTTAIQILGNGGGILMPNLPTSDPAVAGQLWSNGGVLTVSAG